MADSRGDGPGRAPTASGLPVIGRSLSLVPLFGVLACSLLAPTDRELLGLTPAAGGVAGQGLGGDAGEAGAGAGGGAGSAVIGTGGGTGAAPPITKITPPETPDAGPAICEGCEAIRVVGGERMPLLLGSQGGAINLEVCPQNQVVVGFDYEFTFGTPADFGYLTSLAVVCGELAPARSTGTVEVESGELLPLRGVGGGRYGSGGRCPPGQVLVGFEGSSNFDGVTSEIRQIELDCAALSLAPEPGPGSVGVGAPSAAPPLSADFEVSTVLADVALPKQSCPAGQVVRGAIVYAGAWVDGFTLICGSLVLAQGEGEPCSSPDECQSGVCDGVCSPRPCALDGACACEVFERRQYAFCSGTLGHADAALACAGGGMHLAHALDPVTHGWLRTTAAAEGIQAAFWLGADDSAVEGVWQWAADGGAVDLLSELWDDPANLGFEAENCLQMTRDGHWDDGVCTQSLAYVCQSP